MTIVLHPDRHIARTKPLKAATIEMLEQFMRESDNLLAASHKRGDRADDPLNQLGYRFRYYAYLVRDLYMAHQQARTTITKLRKTAGKTVTKRKNRRHA
jgi:hypothetical protein